MMDKTPLISIIIPMRNEERYIEACVRCMLTQDYPHECLEIIVADGASTDGSRAIVKRLAAENAAVRLLDNPQKVVPTGLNLAIRAARGRYILRVDAHAEYATDYVRQCVRYLQETGADNVGGPLNTLPGADTLMARCVAAVTANPLVVGGSRFRTSQKEEYADGAYFGAFPRELFDRIGFFNEALIRNQDNEFNSRILQYGGKIFKTPKIVVRYYNQAKLRGLLRQAFRNGMWHVLSFAGNPASFKIRYFAPFGFAAWLALFGALSIWRPAFLWGLAAVAVPYALMLAIVTVQVAAVHGIAVGAVTPPAVLAYHLAYGTGTMVGLVRFGLFGRRLREQARAFSRPPDRHPHSVGTGRS